VPERDEREAARHACIPWPEWDGLAREQRIEAVAHWRFQRLIEIHRSDAMAKHQERQMALRKARAGSP